MWRPSPKVTEVVTDPDRLRELCAQINANSSYIALDTEFIREQTYWAQLCLIQIASEDYGFTVDAIACAKHLEPIFELLRNPKLVKVMHSSRQDVEIFVRIGEVIPRPIFDTQIAAMLCESNEAPSYADLVSQFCSISLDKNQQRSDWASRPLSTKQLDYAIADVDHLRKIYLRLRKRLENLDRMSWLDEEMQRLYDRSLYVTEPHDAWKRIKLGRSDIRTQSLICRLAEFREQTAQNRNLPRGWIITDKDLIKLAKLRPSSRSEVVDQKQFPKSFGNNRNLDGMLKIINSDRTVDDRVVTETEGTDFPRHSDGLSEALRFLLSVSSKSGHVAASLCSTVDNLKFVASNPGKDNEIFKGWRNEVLGQNVRKFIDGKIAITAEKSGGLKLLKLDGAASGTKSRQ